MTTELSTASYLACNLALELAHAIIIHASEHLQSTNWLFQVIIISSPMHPPTTKTVKILVVIYMHVFTFRFCFMYCICNLIASSYRSLFLNCNYRWQGCQPLTSSNMENMTSQPAIKRLGGRGGGGII